MNLYCDKPMTTTTTTNIADELILHKDIVEHQSKLIANQDKIIENLRKQIENNKKMIELYKGLTESSESRFNKLKTIHSDYVAKVTSGLDSLMNDRIFKF